MAEGAVPNDIIIEALNRAAESHKEGIEHFVPQRPAQDEDADDVDEGLYEEGDEEWEEDEEQEEEEAEAEAPHTTVAPETASPVKTLTKRPLHDVTATREPLAKKSALHPPNPSFHVPMPSYSVSSGMPSGGIFNLHAPAMVPGLPVVNQAQAHLPAQLRVNASVDLATTVETNLLQSWFQSGYWAGLAAGLQS